MAAFCRQEFTFVFRKMLQGPDGEYAADMEMTCPYTYQTNSASFPPRTMPTTGDGGIIGTVSGDDGKIYNKYASYTTLGSGATNPVRYNKGDLPTFVATPSGYNEVTRGPVLHVSSVAGTEKYQVHATVTWFEDYSAYIDVFFDRDTCAVKMYAIGGEKASDGGWRFDRTSTRRLVKSETVVRGATCELPDAATMEEYVGADFELYMDDRGRFWFEGAPDDAPDDTMQSSYLKRMVSSPVLVTKDVNLYCAYFISDDSKLVKFGTLKNMFGVYKEKSDAALEERLANLPSGGADMEAVNAAMDARLAGYTTERDQAVSNAVGAAKTELRGEMPKPFDFVENNDDGGYLRMKNIAPYAISDAEGVSGNEYIPVCLWRRNAGNNPQGLLLVEKAQVNALIDAKLAEVRKAVEGVVLYESDDPSKGVDVSLPDFDVSGYERISVEVMCHIATGLGGSVSPCVVDIPAAEFAWLSASTSSWVMRPYVVALNRAAASERYLLMNLRARHAAPASRSGLRVVPDFGEGGLILAPGSAPQSLDDANLRDSATGTAAYVRRIVGYPRLPEVV